MKAYWNCTKEQLEEMFGFREKGLTEEEVERIRKETGENRLSEGRHKSLLGAVDSVCSPSPTTAIRN
ncbi:MAG: cation-transporting P-type ATPase, partial [Roseburia sp.]